MSINKLISIKTPIIDAMDLLGLDHMQDMPVFVRWATLAEKEINSHYQYVKKRAVLEIKDCVACLPSDAKFVQRAVLGDLGCDCEDLFSNVCTLVQTSNVTAVSTNTFLIVDLSSDYREVLGSIPHTIQDNKIILNKNYNGQKLTIQYLGYQLDGEGFLKVGENHVNAIRWYIIWMYYYRKKNKSTNIDYGQMNKAEQEWHRECSNARAKDSELTESDREEIARMIADPLIGRGIDLDYLSGNYYRI